jgi:hypothetical protein
MLTITVPERALATMLVNRITREDIMTVVTAALAAGRFARIRDEELRHGRW